MFAFLKEGENEEKRMSLSNTRRHWRAKPARPESKAVASCQS